MRIGRPLLKLPVRFCGETLAREVAALPQEAWMAHPQQFDGNSSVPLVSPGGELTHRPFGPMAATKWLQQSPYILQIMQCLDATWGRSRLMGLDAGTNVPEHVDIHYYWRTHLRIHIPVITNPAVAFSCDKETIHLAAGDCWILDSFYRHMVANRGKEMRVHLVLDTVGSGRIWDLIQAANAGSMDSVLIKPGETQPRPLDFEQVNAPLIMSPWEMKNHIAYITDWTDDQPGRDEILTALDRFVMAWSGTWARYAVSDAGLPFYVQHLGEVRAALADLATGEVRMRNGRPLLSSIDQFILVNAIAPAILQKLQMGAGVSPAVRLTA